MTNDLPSMDFRRAFHSGVKMTLISVFKQFASNIWMFNKPYLESAIF